MSRIKLFYDKDMQVVENQVNSFLTGSITVKSVNVTPVYTTVLEDTILMGFMGFIHYEGVI